MTDYLWKQILKKDMLSRIIENYAAVIEEKDQETGKTRYKQIFPRYHQLMAESGWQHAFDKAACAAYAVKGDQFATYDSVRSIACKGEYVLNNGLMGMMCWEYGGDSAGELTRAMHDSLNP